jgi:ribosomal protein S12 methylthiotransferase accessory factor YcaO
MKTAPLEAVYACNTAALAVGQSAHPSNLGKDRAALAGVEVVRAFANAAELLERSPEGAPWILVEDVGAGAVAIGPRFGRGARLCFHCYFARRLSQFATDCRPYDRPLSASARDCLERIASSVPTENPQQLVVQPDGHVVTHWVLPLPSCVRCLAAPAPAQPLGLLDLVSDRVGIVSRIQDVSPATALLPTVLVLGGRTDAFAPTRAVAIGLASDVQRELACIRAVAECVERYCPSFIPRGLRTARSTELHGEVHVSPETRRHERERPAEPLSWIQATRLGTGQAVWVPAGHVLLPFTADRVPRYQSSSGLAAGRTLGDAIEAGLQELEERDGFMRAWYGHDLPGRCEQELLLPEMRLARVPARWGPPTIAAFLELPTPPFCSAGLGCHPDEARAARSAQLEAIASHTFLSLALAGAPRAPADPPSCVSAAAWAHATEERLRNVRRAWLEPRAHLTPAPARAREEFLFCDLTTADVARAGIHVARVFHPDCLGFHARGAGRSSTDAVPPPF